MVLLDFMESPSLASILFIVTSVTLPLIILIIFRRQSASNSLPLPDLDEIIGLRVYPVKSCRGFEVKSAKLLRTGLDLDRNWMFMSTVNREFITIRQNSDMTLIRTAWDSDTDMLTITLHDYKIEIPAHPSVEWLESNAELSKAEIWGEKTDAWEYPASLTLPISEFLKMDVRLVYKGPTPRVLRGCGAPHRLGRTEAIKFADMMPVLVSSLGVAANRSLSLIHTGWIHGEHH